jgi:hypothetical protein
LVRKDHRVCKERQDRLDLRDFRVSREIPVIQVSQDLKGQSVLKALKVYKGFKEILARLV